MQEVKHLQQRWPEWASGLFGHVMFWAICASVERAEIYTSSLETTSERYRRWVYICVYGCLMWREGCSGLEQDGLDVEDGWTIGELDADTGITEPNADSIFKYSETSRTCVCWPRTCREAPQAPWRTWSCRWSTPPPVRRYSESQMNLLLTGEPGSTLTSTILVTLARLVCGISTWRGTGTGDRRSMLINCGAWCRRRRRKEETLS